MAQEPETTTKRAELPMRLTRLRVKNFRSIADIDIPLSPLTVLVGPNGSGKSNVVDALRFVRDVFARGLDQAVMDREGMGVIQRWGTEGNDILIGVTVELLVDSEISIDHTNVMTFYIEYDFVFNELTDGRIVVHSEYFSIIEKDMPTVKVVSNGDILTVEYGEMNWEGIEGLSDMVLPNNNIRGLESLFDRALQLFYYDERWYDKYYGSKYWKWVERITFGLEKKLHDSLFYTLNPSDLRQPQQMLREYPFDEKGRNLAAVLRRVSRSEGANWNNLLFTLRQTVTAFENIEIEAVGGYLATRLYYQDGDAQRRTSYLGQESDGTIRMLGILAALLQEPSQPFVSIEEPEANIHPGALAVLSGVLDEASLRSQILVTTHSPDMLDHLPVESFLVVEKIGDTTHVGPLDASQKASVRKRLFTPGELFRMKGLQRQTEPESAS